MISIPPLWSPFVPLRLLPNAASCANGEAAPLFALPLMRKPSAARWLRSSCDASIARALLSGAVAKVA